MNKNLLLKLVNDLERIVKKANKEKKPNTKKYKEVKENIEKELVKIKPLSQTSKLHSDIFFGLKSLVSHTSSFYIKDEKKFLKFNAVVDKLKQNLKVDNKKKKKIVLKYNTKLLPELIHDNDTFKSYIKGNEFKKLTPTAQKMFIEVSNTHKYLGCKEKQEVVCSVKKPVVKKPTPAVRKPTPAVKKPTPAVKTKKKRCPKGTRRNVKTGNCEPLKKISPLFKTSTNNQDLLQALVGIIATVDKNPSKLKDTKIVKEYEMLRKMILKNKKSDPSNPIWKSYSSIISHGLDFNVKKKSKAKTLKKKEQKTVVSPIYEVKSGVSMKKLSKEVEESIKAGRAKTRTPRINAALSSVVDLSPYSVMPVFNVFDKAPKQTLTQNLCKSDEEIYVKKKKDDKLLTTSKCFKWDHPVLKQIMMRNFKSSKSKTNCSKLVGPKQYLSNCWFNTFFMCFFISENSQKFFRHLRQVMIEGKTLPVGDNPNKPLNKELIKPMFYLNSLIDACLSGNLLGAVNTNVIIDLLYKSKLSEKFRPPNKAHNPINFYMGILSAIEQRSIYIKKLYLEYKPSKSQHGYSIDEYSQDRSQFISNPSKVNRPADLFIVEGDPLQGRKKYGVNKKNQTEFNQFVPQYRKDLSKSIVLDGEKYTLDCVVIRDNSHGHFSAFITCDGKEKWFDGAGLYKPIDFKWKDLINKNVDIDDAKFTTPGTKRKWMPMKWNFMKGYFAAFYYREKK